MPYNVIFDDKVTRKDILAVPKANAVQIMRAISERLTVDPEGIGKPLQYSLKGHYRLRVGDWRIIYMVKGNTVIISSIGNRKDVYDS